MPARRVEVTQDDLDEYIRECSGESIEICGASFDPAEILREMGSYTYHFIWDDLQDEAMWECTECGNTYTYEEDAEDCCREEEDEYDNEDDSPVFDEPEAKLK